MALYIAADTTLPLVPWDKNAPAFHVTSLVECEQVVLKHFSKPHVYYAGASEGCGCAFNVGREFPPDQYEPAELAKAQASVASLVAYIRAAGVQEIYACMEDDQEKAPVHFHRVRPEQLLGDAFVLQQRELLTIERTPTERTGANDHSTLRFDQEHFRPEH